MDGLIIECSEFLGLKKSSESSLSELSNGGLVGRKDLSRT